MFANHSRNLFVLVALALSITVIMILAVAPSAAAPTINHVAFPDYAQRHPDLSNPQILKAIGSDYHERHPELINRLGGTEIDLSLPRRPDFSILVKHDDKYAAEQQAGSDYFVRHPELKTLADADSDLSDYYLRHRDEFQSTREATLWRYFLNHLYAKKMR